MRSKYRRGTVGQWILLGKMYTRKANCYVCGKPMAGEQLVYSSTVTKEVIVVGSECVKRFEASYSNPEERKIKAFVPGETAIERTLTKREEETQIRELVKKIQSARGDVKVRRALIKSMIDQAKKDPSMIRVVGEVIKRGKLHEEIEDMRKEDYIRKLRSKKMLNPSTMFRDKPIRRLTRREKELYDSSFIVGLDDITEEQALEALKHGVVI